MKFGKTYSEFIEKEAGNQLAACSYVDFGRWEKVLKKSILDSSSSGDEIDISNLSRGSVRSSSCLYSPCTTSGLEALPCSTRKEELREGSPVADFSGGVCPSSCRGCDAKFFGELMDQVAEVVVCFNSRAEQLVKLHLATGLRKYSLRGRRNNRESMILQGYRLMNYASMNAIAVRKILKKYDKVHGSREAGIFKSRLTAMRGDLFNTPYLIELGALHLNLADAKENTSSVTELGGEFSCDFEDLTPTLSCKLLESATLDFDLACPICLETVFEPVALGCGHVFCNNCACTAASVLGNEGPRTARCDAQCAVCRQAGVYPDTVKLKELSLLIKNRCPEYWKERFQREREQQIKLKKEFYDQQLEALLHMRYKTLRF